MAAALADDLCQRLLGIAEFGDQAAVALGLFQRRQVLALDIFDNGGFERLPVG